VLFHENVIGHVIIGEATLNLALGDQEISVATLIDELGKMAENEESDTRLAQIADARSWLKNFVKPERLHLAQMHWQKQTEQQRSLPDSEQPIRLASDDDEDR